jgi:cytochrome c peroxidase
MIKILKYIFCIFIIFAICYSCIKQVFIFYPKGWLRPAYELKNNPLTPEKVYLGRVLFYDPIISRDSSISCASCHSQYNAFAHADHALSHGIGDKIGTRNAPALMNLAWQKNLMWDGAVHHLDAQTLAPITNPSEMDENIGRLIQKLNRSEIYRELFYKAYKDSIPTGERLLKSISTFLLTLVSSNSKYDLVMKGKELFTSQEKKGYEIFKKNCSNCHKEPLFTSDEFENNGLFPDKKLFDIGRAKISLNPNDSFKFKVPTLRNIEFSFPYMHDGRFKNLQDVINHYNGEKFNHINLSEKLNKTMKLNSAEKTDLVAFLLTLTDKSFMFDSRHSFPEILKKHK